MRGERWFFAIALVLLAAFPAVTWDLVERSWLASQTWSRSVSVGSYCLAYLIAAQALNVQVGFTGLLQLGAVAFVGIGAYTSALLLTATNQAGAPALIAFYDGIVPDLDGWLRPALFFLDPHFLAYATTLPAAVLAAVLLSLALGVPTLRLAGDYFALVTLGFAQIFYLAVKNEEWLTRGAAGVKDIPPLFSFCQGPDKIEFFDKTAHYFLGVALLAVTLYVVVKIRGSRIGRGFAAVRDDHLVAASHGVHVVRYRIGSFVVFASLAALAGVVLIARNKLVSPNDLLFWESILYLCAIVLGGLGSVRGAFVGALILGALGEVMRITMLEVDALASLPSQVRYILFGVILIVVMRFKPDGLFPAASEEAARGEEGRSRHRDATAGWFAIGGAGGAAAERAGAGGAAAEREGGGGV